MEPAIIGFSDAPSDDPSRGRRRTMGTLRRLPRTKAELLASGAEIAQRDVVEAALHGAADVGEEGIGDVSHVGDMMSIAAARRGLRCERDRTFDGAKDVTEADVVGERASRKPPRGPRLDSTSPARLSSWKICSRKRMGMRWRPATSRTCAGTSASLAIPRRAILRTRGRRARGRRSGRGSRASARGQCNCRIGNIKNGRSDLENRGRFARRRRSLGAMLGSDEARALHAEHPPIDLHADTLMWSRWTGYDLHKRHEAPLPLAAFGGHVDLPRMREGGMGAQFFGLVSLPLADRVRGMARIVHEQIDALDAQMARKPGALRLVRTADEITRRATSGRAGRAPRDRGRACARGRSRQRRRRSRDAACATSASSISARTRPASRRTARAGATVGPHPLGPASSCESCEDSDVLVDLAHVNSRASSTRAGSRSKPPIVSHTGVLGAFEHWRNIDDAQLPRGRRQGRRRRRHLLPALRRRRRPRAGRQAPQAHRRRRRRGRGRARQRLGRLHRPDEAAEGSARLAAPDRRDARGGLHARARSARSSTTT